MLLECGNVFECGILSISSLPEQIQPLMYINPLAIVIEQTRLVAIDGVQPSILYILLGTFIALIGCEISYRGFQRARRGLPMSFDSNIAIKATGLSKSYRLYAKPSDRLLQSLPWRISNYIVNFGLWTM